MAVGDWNYSAAFWTLDTSIYVSSPSSIRWYTEPTYNRVSLLKHAVSGVIREGRIETWFRRNSNFCYPVWIFRSQEPDGTAQCHNCYIVRADSSQALWFYMNDAEGYEVVASNIPLGITIDVGTWYRFRISWFESYNLLNEPSTALQIERWTGSEWVACSGVYYDANRRFESSSINRVGVGISGGTTGAYYVWHDDTAIYKAA